MEPITALATITQLIGLFVAERRGRGEFQQQEFMKWLEHHRHEELKQMISNTAHLSTEVDAILQADHETILDEIRAANDTLAQVMAQLHTLRHLTSVLSPDSQLSNFSMDVLVHFENSGERNMITLPDASGVKFGNSGGLASDDPRFLNDDISALEQCGFIKLVKRQSSYAVFELTRQGAEYARLTSEQSHNHSSGSES